MKSLSRLKARRLFLAIIVERYSVIVSDLGVINMKGNEAPHLNGDCCGCEALRGVVAEVGCARGRFATRGIVASRKILDTLKYMIQASSAIIKPSLII